MYKTIITPEKDSVQINLPEDYIGKKIEITAHILNKVSARRKKEKDIDLAKLTDIYKEYSYDISHYKFNRDELNER